jgi:multiple sugar transport system ATP-binding protein
MTSTGLKDATVVYPGGATALDHVTVTAEAGEILAVLGPSGSGKSTLLRAVAGLVPVREGEVLIGGRSVTALTASQRQVAMVFESDTVIPFLDVARNLGWGLEVRRVEPTQIRERVGRQARGLRLDRLLPRLPRTLSSGERSRVGIGHALVHAPSAFLFDEPLAHLDAAERRAVRHRIQAVVGDHDVATLYVTHDQDEAMGIADRAVLLDAGRVVQIDPPRRLYDRPGTIFAAAFVGSPTIGLLPARPIGAAGSAGYTVGARTLPLWAPLPPALASRIGRDVVLGIRPEHVRDARAGSDPNLVTLPATVVVVEDLGAHVVVTLEIAAPAVTAPGAPTWESGPHGNARLRSVFDHEPAVRPGDTVPIAIDIARAHVFDAGTGRAVHHPEEP